MSEMNKQEKKVTPINKSVTNKRIYKHAQQTQQSIVLPNRFQRKETPSPLKTTNQISQTPVSSAEVKAPTKKQQPIKAPIYTPPDINSEIEQERTEKRALLQQEVQAEKEELLKTLKAEADKELEVYKQEQQANLEREKDKILKDAYEEALKKGNLETEKKVTELSKELLNAINSIATDKKRMLEQASKDMLTLGFAIAEKVIQTSINNDDKIFQNILKEALSKVTDKDKVIIKVSVEDAEHARQYKKAFERELRDFKHLDIQEDPDIESGGCVIETNLGYIDSSIQTKLSLIERALMNIFEEENPELSKARDIKNTESNATIQNESAQPPNTSEPTPTHTETNTQITKESARTEHKEEDSFSDNIDTEDYDDDIDDDLDLDGLDGLDDLDGLDENDFDDDFDDEDF